MTGFDLTRFHTLLRTQTFGRNLIFEPTVGSTMDLAREAATRGAAEGTLAATDEQTAGRGRLGRSWITPPAVNLASTLVLRPPLSMVREVAMIAPLAICHAVEDVAGIRPGIKWPNDVLAGGKKLAGVLIETDLTDEHRPFVLSGAGINVNFDPRQYEEIRDIATSVKAETGRDADREALLAAYLWHFEQTYAAAKASESARGRWLERLETLGQRVHAAWRGGEADGVAEDVDDDGALLLRTESGDLLTLEAADVTLRA